MRDLLAKNEVIQRLQREVLSLQGATVLPGSQRPHIGLGPLEQAFPGRTFPTAAVHEFISHAPEDASATNGFITGLLSQFMRKTGTCLWVSNRRTVFPPAIKLFGIEPHRIVFIDVDRAKDALWVIEEGLKCNVLAAVVGELKELSFTESRRLQLAVEQSKLTGFIHRYQPRTENTVACVTRWKVKPIASVAEDGMPGLGHPRWDVQLNKVRNGKPGFWQVEWAADTFRFYTPTIAVPTLQTRKAG